ncbi:hypothetical protein [Saccharomonospora piscinae]|uniref:hypothetical protein n=1 Tax=Saccharomonospora piscinae TaxID=687388 RepID=UPI0004ACF3BC|nr:hypothetical protein [Saccharomonospora piscinae]
MPDVAKAVVPHSGSTDAAEIDAVLRRVERLAAVGAGVSSMEALTAIRDFDRGSLLNWQVARTRFPWMVGRAGRVLDVVFDKEGLRVLHGLRLLSAGTVLAGRKPRRSKRAAKAYLAGSSHAMRLRSPYGSDGSEVLLSITLTALTLADLAGSDTRARKACLWFIAAQSCLSYGIAGSAKAISPVWRDGSAIRDIFRTRIFGQEDLFRFLRDKPRLNRAIGWATIGGEALFPLVLLAPKPLARALLAVGLCFHTGNAVAMGLNRFVWAFVSTYPAIEYCARGLGRQERTGS